MPHAKAGRIGVSLSLGFPLLLNSQTRVSRQIAGWQSSVVAGGGEKSSQERHPFVPFNRQQQD